MSEASEPEPKPRVFVHTNERQWLGALVSRHSLRRNSAHAERFEVEFLTTGDHPFLRAREGQLYLREGERVPWRYENLQSFTPLRFRPPEVMGYRGRALVIDPDVFAVGDVWELLARDMQGKAVCCRLRSGSKGLAGGMASSVMLLDCAKLHHWRCEEQFAELFAFERDYMDWILLRDEPSGTIGRFEDEWNDFDRLTPRTKLIHNTKRQTQPWKTGLPVDFTPATKKVKALNPATWLRPLTRKRAPERYLPHPDPAQERFFFGLLRECVEQGTVNEALLREEMRLDHLRHDALEVLERTPPLAA
ncbi:MAG: hypothetical protein OZ948_05325 [Deltaproteobacteria bacterium]|nr:hypothetical protein [Deltaproteobacteria bacterium]